MITALPSAKKPEIMMLYDSILEEGREEGLKEGLKKGREEGREEAKKQIILSGYQNGISIALLCLLTDYCEEDVLSILVQAEGRNQR